jgi:hypothetical protein
MNVAGARFGVLVASLSLLLPQFASAATTKVIYLTTGSSWTVPSDWNNANNSIEVIGGGGAGAQYGNRFYYGGGGGGGAYSNTTNLTLTAGGSVSYQVGGVSGDTIFNGTGATCDATQTAEVCAKGGSSGSGTTAGPGGSAAAGVGTLKYSGGNGGAGGPTNFSQYSGGGGGAAGPNGNGIGGSSSSSTGGGGDAGYGGVGGGKSAAGGAGTEWGSYGSGGGGGGGDALNVTPGGSGGNYGGGGGGMTSQTSPGSGTQGIIVITYTTNNCPTSADSAAGGSGFSLFGGIINRLISTLGFNSCVSNASGLNYFIPARTSGELQSFFNAIPRLTGVSTQTP